MHPLNAEDIDEYDIKSVLKSKYFIEMEDEQDETSELYVNEPNYIQKDQLFCICSKFNQFLNQRNLELTMNSLLELFNLFINQKYLSQEIIDTFVASNFLQNINVCILLLQGSCESSVQYSDELSFICILLNFLAYLSDLFIELMFEHDTLNVLITIFVKPGNRVSPNLFFKLFGNACSIKKIALFFQNPLFVQIQKYISCESIFTQKFCLYCFFALTKHCPIPLSLIDSYFMSIKTILLKASNVISILNDLNAQHDNNDAEYENKDTEYEYENEDIEYENEDIKYENEGIEYENEDFLYSRYDFLYNQKDLHKQLNKITENFGTNLSGDSIKKHIYKILVYIIEILDQHSSHPETFRYVVNAKIPSILLSIISYFPIIVQQKFLKIIQNILKMITDGDDKIHIEDNMIFFSKSLDPGDLINLLDTSNDPIISMVYDILYKIGFYDKSLIQDFITTDMIRNTIEKVYSVNFHSKTCVLKFLALIIINDNQNKFAEFIITESVVEEFIELAQQKEDFVKDTLGAITKLFVLTYDNPDLHMMLEPYVISC